MRQKQFSLRCIAFGAFLATCSLGFAQMPTGFPTMPNTGNAEADAQAYEQAKTTWIATNPGAPVNTTTTFTAPATEAENAAYEASKTLASQNNTPTTPVDGPGMAQRQKNTLESYYQTHYAEMEANNPRQFQAYLDAFQMMRGQSVVTITAAEYNAMYQELKTLVDANNYLFNVTQ